jgi:hypothetical protein
MPRVADHCEPPLRQAGGSNAGPFRELRDRRPRIHDNSMLGLPSTCASSVYRRQSGSESTRACSRHLVDLPPECDRMAHGRRFSVDFRLPERDMQISPRLGRCVFWQQIRRLLSNLPPVPVVRMGDQPLGAEEDPAKMWCFRLGNTGGKGCHRLRSAVCTPCGARNSSFKT